MDAPPSGPVALGVDSVTARCCVSRVSRASCPSSVGRWGFIGLSTSHSLDRESTLSRNGVVRRTSGNEVHLCGNGTGDGEGGDVKGVGPVGGGVETGTIRTGVIGEEKEREVSGRKGLLGVGTTRRRGKRPDYIQGVSTWGPDSTHVVGRVIRSTVEETRPDT